MNRVLILGLLVISQIGKAQTDSLAIKNHGLLHHQFEMGLMTSRSETTGNNADFVMSYVANIALGNFVKVGLGTSYEQYADFVGVPLFAQFRANLSNDKQHPFIYMRAGHSYMRNPDDEFNHVDGGGNYALGLGYEWNFEKNQLSLSMGYKRQNLETIGDGWQYYWMNDFSSLSTPSAPNQERISWNLQRIEFRVGILF